MDVKKKILDAEKGQAIFELILFMPFLVYFVTLLFTAGSSINGSINQQKATRGYFHYILKGNSILPVKSDLGRLEPVVPSVSVASIGWAESRPSDGEQFGACYKFSTLYSSTDEICKGQAEDETSSIFVKPFTFYGVCSATYTRQAEGGYWMDPSVAANVRCNL